MVYYNSKLMILADNSLDKHYNKKEYIMMYFLARLMGNEIDKIFDLNP